MRQALFLGFIFISTIFAQINSPLSYSNNQLVYGSGLPAEMISMIPDTAVQILNNPARAGGVDQNFIFLSYFPSSLIRYNSTQISPLFKCNALLGTPDSHWLISLGGNQSLNRLDNDKSYGRQYNEKNYQTLIANLKVTKIFNHFSLGIIAQKFLIENFSSRNYDYYRNIPGERIDIRNTLLRDNLHINRIGLETGFIYSNWDVTMQYFLQRGTLKNNQNSRNYYYRDIIYSDETETIYEQDTRSNYQINKEGFVHQYIGNFVHKTDMIGENDQLYISIRGEYATVLNDYMLSHTFNAATMVNDSLTSYQDDRLSQDIDSETNNNSIYSSIGYIIEKQKKNLIFQTGLILRFRYKGGNYYNEPGNSPSRTRNFYYNNTIYTIKNSYSGSETSITFPFAFFVNIDDLQLFSLLSFRGDYNLLHTDVQERSVVLESPTNISEGFSKKEITSNIYTTFNFGAKYTLLDNFDFQVAFRGDFSRYSYWNIAIGYHY